MNESLKTALKEIESMKNKINECEKNLNLYMKKIKILEEDKNKESQTIMQTNNSYIKKNNNDSKSLDIKLDSPLKINDLEKEREKSEQYELNYNYNTPYSTRTYKGRYSSRINTEPNNEDKPKNTIKETEDFYNYLSFRSSLNKLTNQRTLQRNLTEKNLLKNPDQFKYDRLISTQLFTKNAYNNRACIFSRIDNKICKIFIVYGKKPCNLECYDYNLDIKYILFRRFHQDSFDSCRYFYDNNNQKDLIITSSLDKHVKVVDFQEKNSKIILDLNFDYVIDVIINTVYFLDNKLIIPFAFHRKENRLSFYNLQGGKIKELIDNPGFVLGINGYCYKKIINFAIIANTEGIFAYNINDYSLYHKFIPSNYLESICFTEGHIIEKDEKIILLGPLFSAGFLFLWDFVNKDLIKVIRLAYGIMDICVWNNNYIFAALNGSKDDKFILLNINSEKIEKGFGCLDIESNCFGIHLLKDKNEVDLLMTYTGEGKLHLFKIEDKINVLKNN
jgi:hypothetical protein